MPDQGFVALLLLLLLALEVSLEVSLVFAFAFAFARRGGRPPGGRTVVMDLELLPGRTALVVSFALLSGCGCCAIAIPRASPVDEGPGSERWILIPCRWYRRHRPWCWLGVLDVGIVGIVSVAFR